MADPDQDLHGKTLEAARYLQLPRELTTVPAALLRIRTLPNGSLLGRLRCGDGYLQRVDAIALAPFYLHEIYFYYMVCKTALATLALA